MTGAPPKQATAAIGGLTSPAAGDLQHGPTARHMLAYLAWHGIKVRANLLKGGVTRFMLYEAPLPSAKKSHIGVKKFPSGTILCVNANDAA